MTKSTVRVELTYQQLVDIRVAVLTRLDKLKPPTDSCTIGDATSRYERIRSLMTEGGPLHRAIVEINGNKPSDVAPSVAHKLKQHDVEL